jgi:hypothetical protein
MKPPSAAEIVYPIRLAARHLQDCGVGPERSVTLAGRAGLSAQLWLCRHDYQAVNHLIGGAGGAEPAEVVLLTDLVEPEAVDEAVRGAVRRLTHGGWLVTWSRDPGTVDDPVHAVLRARGFVLDRCVRDGEGELHIAHLPEVERRAA